MSDTITITKGELFTLTESVVNRTLEKMGHLSPYLNRTEAIKRLGRGNYLKAVDKGYIHEVKWFEGGRKDGMPSNSRLKILRSEVEAFESGLHLKAELDSQKDIHI